MNEAKRRNPATAGQVFDFIRDVLLKRADYIPAAERDEYLRFVTRFQQTTSPVTAKGIEDTAFYAYNRLVSLNEVGGEPARFGVSPSELHAWLAARRQQWPSALSATSTHDTKRSEDVRARISVLSEMPAAWRSGLARWSRLNKRHHTTVERARRSGQERGVSVVPDAARRVAARRVPGETRARSSSSASAST